jgi:hypothetical protein
MPIRLSRDLLKTTWRVALGVKRVWYISLATSICKRDIDHQAFSIGSGAREMNVSFSVVVLRHFPEYIINQSLVRFHVLPYPSEHFELHCVAINSAG